LEFASPGAAAHAEPDLQAVHASLLSESDEAAAKPEAKPAEAEAGESVAEEEVQAESEEGSGRLAGEVEFLIRL
jgi:hypothetical protein